MGEKLKEALNEKETLLEQYEDKLKKKVEKQEQKEIEIKRLKEERAKVKNFV